MLEGSPKRPLAVPTFLDSLKKDFQKHSSKRNKHAEKPVGDYIPIKSTLSRDEEYSSDDLQNSSASDSEGTLINHKRNEQPRGRRRRIVIPHEILVLKPHFEGSKYYAKQVG
jgi:hypothetical protein